MKLTQKIWEVKNQLPVIKKDTSGFKFKYANLGDIEKKLTPILAEKKVGYSHRTDIEGDNNILITTVFNLENTEEVEVHKLVIPSKVQLAGMNEYQSLGSALTYFRRYHLVIAFGILTNDDVDAVQPEVKQVNINHVEKIKQLIQIGRGKPTIEKYFEVNEKKMNGDQIQEVKELISNLK